MKKKAAYYDEMDYDDEMNDEEERAYKKEVYGDDKKSVDDND